MTSMDWKVTFGATDVRLKTDTAPWAARARRDQGLPPLPTDETTLLMEDIDSLTTSTVASPSAEGQSGDLSLPESSCPGIDLAESGCAVAPLPSNQTAGPGPLACSACPRTFFRLRKLKGHWESMHAASHMAYQCAECERTFHPYHKCHMKGHLRRVHGYSWERAVEADKAATLREVKREGAALVAPPACLTTPLTSKENVSGQDQKRPQPQPSQQGNKKPKKAAGPARKTENRAPVKQKTSAKQAKSSQDPPQAGLLEDLANNWAMAWRRSYEKHAEEKAQLEAQNRSLTLQVHALRKEVQRLRKKPTSHRKSKSN